MKGINVTVYMPRGAEFDRFGNEISLFDEIEVSDVLISPGATESLDASRPEGVSVAYSLQFPKTFKGSLEACEIELPQPWGGRYRVIGNPMPYIDANTPTRWNRPVEVEMAHG